MDGYGGNYNELNISHIPLADFQIKHFFSFQMHWTHDENITIFKDFQTEVFLSGHKSRVKDSIFSPSSFIPVFYVKKKTHVKKMIRIFDFPYHLFWQK